MAMGGAITHVSKFPLVDYAITPSQAQAQARPHCRLAPEDLSSTETACTTD